MTHPDELLLDYAVGALGEHDRVRVARHLERCSSCRASVREMEEDLAGLAVALPPVAPPEGLRERILASARHSCDDEVGRFFDLPPDEAARLIDAVEDAASWEPGPAGVSLMHLAGGPSLAAADCGFVRVPAGAPFPQHRHLGEERTMVVQGLLIDDNGRVYRRGDVATYPAGSVHSFRAAEGADLVYALVLFEGVAISGGPEIRVNKPG